MEAQLELTKQRNDQNREHKKEILNLTRQQRLDQQKMQEKYDDKIQHIIKQDQEFSQSQETKHDKERD
ncbi:unnamed protein product, partial [Didymodactylos carnosus]